MIRSTLAIVAAAGLAVPLAALPPAPAGADTVTDRAATAWQNGALSVDTRGLVSRSDVVLERAAARPYQSMPLGNGRLGAAVWQANGLTVQLNRGDSFPDLKSPGQLELPGLGTMSAAPDAHGRLSLYDGALRLAGGGMTATTYVAAGTDQLVVEVTGADPTTSQTATLHLWPGRTPTTYASGGTAALAETFAGSDSAGGPGQTFGTLAAVTASARDVSATVVDPVTVRLKFRPRADGTFRVVVGAPHYAGGPVADAATASVAGSDVSALPAHLAWWHAFWDRVDPMRIDSSDGAGRYLEALRAQNLYIQAASSGGPLPASHGGVADLFEYAGDHHDWYPAGYWHFNLREGVQANFGAGTAFLNTPFFRLYLDNYDAMRQWTRVHMPNTEGVCVSETLRFDGAGQYPGQTQCDATSPASYVVRILTTGPEVAREAWQQYRFTGDRSFLERAYPLMADTARFLLSYAKVGPDGLLHTEPANALENLWDTRDPANQLAAMRGLFPLVANAADLLGRDHDLAAALRGAVAKIPPDRIVTRNGKQVIAWSAEDSPIHNFQNPELEALWPWGEYSDTRPGWQLINDTFTERVNPQSYDWGMDSVWAARLGRADTVKNLLLQGTQDFQVYPSGFSYFGKGGNPAGTPVGAFGSSPYLEWNAVVASGLQEALVQRYDGLLRIAPAWPQQWDVTGAVDVEGGHRISVEVRHGTVQLVGIQAGSDDELRIRNPWPGQEIDVVDGTTGNGTPIVKPTTADEITLPVSRGSSYVLQRTEFPYPSFAYRQLSGSAPTGALALGQRSLGIGPPPPPPCATPDPGNPLLSWDVPATGDTLTDGSPYERTGVVAGGSQTVPGPDGPAEVLDGSRYLTTQSSTALGYLPAFSFAATVRIDGSGSYRRIVDDIPIGDGGTDGFLVDVTPDNNVRFIGAGTLVITGATVPTGQFVKLAITLADDGTLTVYEDGQPTWTGSIDPTGINACASRPLRVGADQSGSSLLVGAVDDISLWARALTPAEVGAL